MILIVFIKSEIIFKDFLYLIIYLFNNFYKVNNTKIYFKMYILLYYLLYAIINNIKFGLIFNI